jgi:hypothetical protein
MCNCYSVFLNALKQISRVKYWAGNHSLIAMDLYFERKLRYYILWCFTPLGTAVMLSLLSLLFASQAVASLIHAVNVSHIKWQHTILFTAILLCLLELCSNIYQDFLRDLVQWTSLDSTFAKDIIHNLDGPLLFHLSWPSSTLPLSWVSTSNKTNSK